MKASNESLLDMDGFEAYLHKSGSATNTIISYRRHLMDYAKWYLDSFDTQAPRGLMRPTMQDIYFAPKEGSHE